MIPFDACQPHIEPERNVAFPYTAPLPPQHGP
jgi:hypothetical protein